MNFFKVSVNKMIQSEKDVFEFLFRAQLVCRSVGQDTYYAIYKGKSEKYKGKHVFVKGPYPTMSELFRPMENNLWKKYFEGVEGIPFIIEELYPNMWEKTPLGIRNKLDKNKPAFFMVFEDLNMGNYKTKMHSSKLWPLTEVVEMDKNELVTIPVVEKLSENATKSLLLACLYRYIIGIPDIARRNFMHDLKRDVIYSIDEDNNNKPINIKKGLNKGVYTLMNYYDKNQTEIDGIIEKWCVTVKSMKHEMNCSFVEEMMERLLHLTPSKIKEIFLGIN